MSCSSPYWLCLGGPVVRCVLIDEASLELVGERSWHPHRAHGAVTGYASARCGPLLHRVIAGADKGEQVDHENGHVWDNRRGNLRIVTPLQNSQNKKFSAKMKTGGFKGVSPHGRKFRCAIGHNYRTVYLGLHATAEDAARAYDAKARELFGEFAALNFPDAS